MSSIYNDGSGRRIISFTPPQTQNNYQTNKKDLDKLDKTVSGPINLREAILKANQEQSSLRGNDQPQNETSQTDKFITSKPYTASVKANSSIQSFLDPLKKLFNKKTEA